MTDGTRRPQPNDLADDEATEEVVNDSLGTIDPADTTDTDPDDDPEAGGKGTGEKRAE